MKIAVIGTGYVGLVTGTCLASIGHDVICVDQNKEKIVLLQSGQSPIYEPGIEKLITQAIVAEKLSFTTDIVRAISWAEVVFVAVGTPIGPDGQTNMEYVHAVTRTIGEHLNDYKVIVNKSTVPVGTASAASLTIRTIIEQRGENIDFDIVSNPEFLREGSAIHDFQHPDRIVIGATSERALAILRNVYATFAEQQVPFVETNPETAELIKFVANSFLAMKVAFMNQVANLAEKVGADIHQLKEGIGSDPRIGKAFLNPGPGYGGSCFPKDATSLVHASKMAGAPLTLVQETIAANEQQKLYMVKKITDALGDVTGKTIAVLGVAFKANTDDMREAPAITILHELAARGARFRIFDPQAKQQARIVFAQIAENIDYCDDEYMAAEQAHAVVLLTEWQRFKSIELQTLKSSMIGTHFFDFRNLFTRAQVEEAGFIYQGVGQ